MWRKADRIPRRVTEAATVENGEHSEVEQKSREHGVREEGHDGPEDQEGKGHDDEVVSRQASLPEPTAQQA